MIETEITITVNRKSDIDIIEQKIIENKIQFPVYIREYEFSYQINSTMEYDLEINDVTNEIKCVYKFSLI